MKGNYYISTAIAYTSSKPHIGNTYEIVLADAIARNKRLEGYNVYFQTGTDEHGEKIEIKAREAAVEPQEYVDGVASQIKDIWDLMNTTYDRFVRTTDKNHESVVQHIFKKMYDKGDIYKGEYKGLYCIPCESFWTESQLVDGRCPDCGRDVQEKTEEAYFFKLSKYQDKLVDYINEHQEFIQPESRKNEMLNNFIKPGLQDLCVSRTSFKWGIPVDFDDKHVVYVWLDALTNYITNIGYDVDEQTEEFKKFWPADLHLIGKDIIRFHTIYWPCFLMSLDIPLPKQVFGHPWLLSGTDKMSKSRGNLLYADDLVEKYGLDAIRYFVLHEIPFADDGVITEELIIERNNTDLANILGNLVNRTISMSHKYFEGVVENTQVVGDADQNLIGKVEGLGAKVKKCMDDLKIADAIDEIFNVLRASNKYIDETTPWILAKDENEHDRLKTVLYNLVESIRVCAVYLQPFLPDTADKIFDLINTDEKTYESTNKFGVFKSGTVLNNPEILFARIEKAD
ncbi:MAG: methionine--tRNA ligase [Erysipelotrichales bacterium]|nr:methionine--tRNA ligase [Erysipelotrichales bacterium]